MSQELPVPRQDDRSDGTAVLEWGPTGSPAPRRVGGLLDGVRRHPRLPRALAGLGAAAAFASLLGEWVVMTVPNSGPEGSSIRVPGGVGEVGGFGVGYLVGLLGLTGVVTVALAGTRAARPNARVAGAGIAVALLALLVAATLSLDDSGRSALYYPSDSGFEIEYGRGLVMAFVAVALLGSALRLAGPTVGSSDSAEEARTPDGDGPEEDGEPSGRDAASGGAAAVAPEQRRWRRRRRDDRTPEDEPPAPEGLTVQPSVPFARPDQPPGR
ncbi:hypothetical protein O7606_19435 [Micromonospora sp. WMMD882]|uniref:hypothetical protein n=1 Tax=Micromonospora sp. WMMD882 TaxID=3015151 RepID=UPI00248CE10A|nr:hypothetical protein [Micromonospora sp. WMMD882]WBB78384.1 hypothetical protein O7606_19435 [Micromonospora sp. WMMD882]